MATDPLDPTLLRRDNRQQFLADLLRNAKGAPETALTMGSSLADMAGTGLGTLAGMAKQKLSGEDVDLGAATDTLQEGKFTYAPRTEGGQETLRGLGEVMAPIDKGMQFAGQKAADVTGSPAVGAAVYTGLNMFDPQMLAPGAAKVAALRGAGNVARRAAETAVPMSEALRNVPKGQRGAYTLEDLAAGEGDFAFRSPALEAFDRLKPQEQGRVTGKQLGKALMREGAKKEELTWMGLDDIINSDELVNAADVKKIAEANKPEMDFVTTRSGGELDEDAISEKAYDLMRDDGDLEYPVAVYRGSGRHRDHVETYDTQREADSAIKEMEASDHEAAKEDYLENIEQYIDDEEELAAMTENEKEEWAGQMAADREAESYETENDYDSEPTNGEQLREYWENEVRSNPGQYDIEGGGAPAYGEYTVGREGREPSSKYGVSAGRLQREERYGKGGGDTPEFLKPYMGDQTSDVAEINGQGVLFPQESRSKAFQIEALRRQKRDADPNAAKFKGDVDMSHYDELGENQMFFTRETDRRAPEWGTVSKGVGAYEESTLKDKDGNPIESESNRLNPTRLVEEAQSDWLQRGRKTGFAEPKTMEKLEAEGADEAGRVKAFQEQALSEMPVALEDARIKDFLDDHRARVAGQRQIGEPLEYEDQRLADALTAFEEVSANRGAHDMGEQISTSRNLFSAIYRASPAGSAAEAFADQVRDGIDRLPTMTHSPVKSVTPSSPMKDTRQYTQLAMADALRRAVQEGQQYLAWTPGDIHTKRWGTDTLQYAPSPENPRIFRYSAYDTSRNATGRPLDNLQATADELLGDESNPEGFIDLDSPTIDADLLKVVESKLNYGMHEYPNPDKQRAKRAAGLKKDLEALSKKAMAGERVAGHNSPRAYGFESAYAPMQEDLAAILRREGLELPEVRDIDYGGEKVRGVELTPEIARAAKRGFKLPY